MLDRRSVALDPATHAVRPDLADVRLADRVFAPHYAAPIVRAVATAASLRQARDEGSSIVAELARGDRFELLDVLGDDAWGVATGDRPRVGYLPLSSLGEP